jgi:hypothetical protein
MDPLSIAAGAIGVFQAADRLLTLLSKVKPFLRAQDDVLSLLNEVRIVRDALVGLRETATDKNHGMPFGRASLLEPISACLVHISHLEQLVVDSCKWKQMTDEVTLVDVKRATWVRKNGEVERIRHRLRDSFVALQVAIATINM